MIDWKQRAQELTDAEKDLAFALVKLQDRQLVSAYLNALVAVVHISKSLTDKDWESVHSTCEALRARAVG